MRQESDIVYIRTAHPTLVTMAQRYSSHIVPIDEWERLVQVCSQGPFFALICDDPNSWNKLTALLNRIQKNSLASHVAILTSAFNDLDSFRKLRENFDVHYILPADLADNYVKNFLQSLFRDDKSVPEDIPYELQEKYYQSIMDKIKHISAVITDLKRDISKENLEKLKFEIHKMAGSAAVYGYKSASRIGKSAEENLVLLLNQQESFKNLNIDLDRLLLELKLAFQGIQL